MYLSTVENDLVCCLNERDQPADMHMNAGSVSVDYSIGMVTIRFIVHYTVLRVRQNSPFSDLVSENAR